MLGICRKAGKLTVGAVKTTESLKRGRTKLTVVASDISAKTEKELRFHSAENTEVLRIESNIDELSAALGIKTGVVGVEDDGFAAALLKLANQSQGGKQL